MKHPKPPVAITPETLDELVRKNTAFPSMGAMLNAKGGYFPSCYVCHREVKIIADEYDRLQAQRDDPRRAYRHHR